MMNILKRELRANLKSILIWSICLAALTTIWMTEYSVLSGNSDMTELMESMPKALLDAFGMGSTNFTTLSGFIGAISTYLFLPLGIHGVLLGSSIISKEERDKTIEFLFTLPVSRKRVLVGKILAALINVILLNIITMGTILAVSTQYDKGDDFFSFLGLLFLGIFLVQMVFLSTGMLVASISKRYKKSGNISVSILLVSYMVSVLINMTDKVDFLKFFTPFKYFEASYIIQEENLKLLYVMLSLFIIAIGFIGTFFYYPKRDLTL